MFPERVIEPGSLRVGEGGYAFTVRLPWYRALPLSCVDRVEVLADGDPVSPADLSLEVDGRLFALTELAPRYDTWWYVTDSATVHVRVSRPEGSTAAGPPREITATLGLVIPYLPVDGEPLRIFESCTRTFTEQVAA